MDSLYKEQTQGLTRDEERVSRSFEAIKDSRPEIRFLTVEPINMVVPCLGGLSSPGV